MSPVKATYVESKRRDLGPRVGAFIFLASFGAYVNDSTGRFKLLNLKTDAQNMVSSTQF